LQMTQHDARNQTEHRNNQTDILLGCSVGVSQAGLALTHNVLHLVVAARIPVMFVLSMSKDISSGNADGLPHSGGNVPDNMGSCSFSSVRAWKPLLPHSGGNVPYTMGSCSTRSAKLGSHCCPTMQVAFQQQVSQAATVLKAQ